MCVPIGQSLALIDGLSPLRADVFIERLWRAIKYEEVHLKAHTDGCKGEVRHQSLDELLQFSAPSPDDERPDADGGVAMDSPSPVSVFGDLLDEQGRNAEAGQGHMTTSDFKTVRARQVDAREWRTDVGPADFTEPIGL